MTEYTKRVVIVVTGGQLIAANVQAKIVDPTGGKFTWTEVISTAATYSANAKMRIIKDGTSYSLFYNGAAVGSTSTISDAGVKDNKYHGTFNTYSSNTIDDVIFRPRTDTTYTTELDQYI